MATINKQAWDILNGDEKLAIQLQFIEKKSSWEAGELMNKSHYKYLEIFSRSEKFFKMFTEHFNLFHELIIPDVTGKEEIKDYFRLCIVSRKKVSTVYEELNQKYSYTGKNQREEEIVKQMKLWEKSENPYDHNLYHLIKEFDRWNNFRILPPSIQEPSAFKRRNKKMYQKHLKITVNIPEVSVPKIRKLFGQKRGIKEGLYLPIVSSDTKTKHNLLLKETKEAKEMLTNISLYLFPSKELATEYLELIYQYTSTHSLKCKDGLEFWPKYREIIKKASNYEDVQNIVPSRRYLQLALNKLTYI